MNRCIPFCTVLVMLVHDCSGLSVMAEDQSKSRKNAGKASPVSLVVPSHDAASAGFFVRADGKVSKYGGMVRGTKRCKAFDIYN